MDSASESGVDGARLVPSERRDAFGIQHLNLDLALDRKVTTANASVAVSEQGNVCKQVGEYGDWAEDEGCEHGNDSGYAKHHGDHAAASGGVGHGTRLERCG